MADFSSGWYGSPPHHQKQRTWCIGIQIFQVSKAFAFLPTLSLTDFIALENARVIIQDFYLFQSKTIVIPRQIWYN